MLFSREWLGQYVELPATVGELAARLTAAGFNVEGSEERGDDQVLDVDVTTNRPDCMCHLGLAREVAVIFRRELRPPRPAPVAAGPATRQAVSVEVEDHDDCPRYVARVLRGVGRGGSPAWMVRRLEAIGLRSIDPVVDVTNYVLWEMGQPLHAFDLARLGGGRVVVRRARAGERLRTLDGEERELDPSVLVIADAADPIALAGVMGGLATEVTATTSEVLIESAHFAPALVRQGARRLGMRTDASHRFERGADPEICRRAADRAAELMLELVGGTLLEGAVDERQPQRDWRLHGRLEARRLNAFVGKPIAAAEVELCLGGLGFGLERRGEGVWDVAVPSWRFYDFQPTPAAGPGGEAPVSGVYEADLFEEVLRIHGYDEVPASLPAVGGPDPGVSDDYRRRREVRSHLAACGFAEAVNYGFYSAAADGLFPVVAAGEPPLALRNPLSDRYALLRRSLLPGLLDSARFNLRRGAEAVRLYEVGHLFAAGGGTYAGETEMVGLIAGGTLGTPWDRPLVFDLFHLKGVLESLAAHFGVRFGVRPASLAGLLPGTAAEIILSDGRVVGHLGQVDDPELRVPLAVAQLEIDILGRAGGPRNVRIPSRFPGIELDWTLTHPVEVGWEELAAAIAGACDPELAEFGLKDRYQGEGVPSGAVNSTLRFFYNSSSRSLTQEDVNQRHEALTRALAERFGWRG